MNSFVQRHRDVVIGQLNGFDRIRFRGSKRLLCNIGGMLSFLWQVQVLLKDFKDYAMSFCCMTTCWSAGSSNVGVRRW